MIFEALTKLKRQSIIISILLMGLGIVMLVCPEKYIPSLIMVAGYAMIIYAIEQSLEFIDGENSLMQCISFVLGVVIGLAGLGVLVFRENILNVLSWIFGLLLIVEGKNDLYYAYKFAKRSGRKGWSTLVILAIILMITGVGLIVGQMINALSAFDSTSLMMKMIGVALLLAALISLLKLIWIKPNNEGGDSDAK